MRKSIQALLLAMISAVPTFGNNQSVNPGHTYLIEDVSKAAPAVKNKVGAQYAAYPSVMPRKMGTRLNENTQFVKVSVKADYTEETGNLVSVLLMSDILSDEDNGSIYGEMEQISNGEIVFHKVPVGRYDVLIVGHDGANPKSLKTQVLYFADMDITTDKTIEFDSAAARNHVTFRPVLPGNVPVVWPNAVFNEAGDKVVRDWTNANIGQTYMNAMVCHKRHSAVYQLRGNFNYQSDGTVEEAWNPAEYTSIWINDVPDDIFIVWHCVFDDENSNLYTVLMSTPVKPGDVEVSNNPVNYSECNLAFSNTPYAESASKDSYDKVLMSYGTVLGMQVTSEGFFNPVEKPLSMHYCSEPMIVGDENYADMYVSVENLDKCVYVEQIVDTPFGPKDEGYWDYSGVFAPKVVFRGGTPQLLNSNHTEISYHGAFKLPEGGYWKHYGWVKEFPGHPAFSYPLEGCKGRMGDNVPILSLMTQKIETPKGPAAVGLPGYIGRYGEMRVVDNLCIDAEVKAEGVIVCNDYDEYQNYMLNRAMNNEPKSKISTRFVNRNVKVGDIDGCNISVWEYDENGDDWFAPTLQMLHFRDNTGAVTDRFLNPEDAVLEFAGGDFSMCNDAIGNIWFTEKEAQWTVEYAPYGSDSYLPIEVEEVSELYHMPAFGHFYRGTLGNVDRKSPNGWFDMRIKGVDDAGNTQTQIISPAFCINSLGGVEVVGDEGLQANEGEVFTLSGLRMNRAELAPGIYVVRNGEKSRKLVVR